MVLKAGQRPKRVLKVAAMSMLRDPIRFFVARPFAEALKIGDTVQFLPNGVTDGDASWDKTWIVIRVTGDPMVRDTREIYVIEVQ